MSDRFIKFIVSEESAYLLKNHPNAFLLLCHIAQRARRVSGNPDGLEIGCAYIGDYKECGIETEMKYRTAKKILEMRQHVKIIETCRSRKKSTTGITTVGTLVKILRSDIWDINPESNNDRINDRVTTEQRPNNDEQERKRKNKKEEEDKEKNKKEIFPSDSNSNENPLSIEDSPQYTQVAVGQDFEEKQHNIYYQSDTKKLKDLPPKILRRQKEGVSEDRWIRTTDEEHLHLIEFIEKKKEYAEKGKGESFVELCYDELFRWKQDTEKKQLKKGTDPGRITHWVCNAVKKRQLEDEEIKAREARLKNVPKNKIEDNKKRALDILHNYLIPKNLKIDLLSSSIEFLLDRSPQPICVFYDSHGFEEQLLNTIHKTGCKKIAQLKQEVKCV